MAAYDRVLAGEGDLATAIVHRTAECRHVLREGAVEVKGGLLWGAERGGQRGAQRRGRTELEEVAPTCVVLRHEPLLELPAAIDRRAEHVPWNAKVKRAVTLHSGK